MSVWVLRPEGERLELVCLVLHGADRVSPRAEPLIDDVPALSTEVRELAHWVIEQWARARGLDS